MKNILVVGAGRSSKSLIDYLLAVSEETGWMVMVADAQIELAEAKISGHSNGLAVWLDVEKPNDRKDLIKKADIVVSLLPPHLHTLVARDCIVLRKHLVTASYVSAEFEKLDDPAKERSLVLMGEMGLDPGIDHMSAMQKITEIKEMGGTLSHFRSYTGGLVAPESDTNPWHYKFTWSPRNVVLAGKGTAQYLVDGKLKYIPYHQLFKSAREVSITGLGTYEMYPNRDSLTYRSHYGLQDIPNILRGTLRHCGYAQAWDALINLGLTDDTFPIKGSKQMRYRELVEAFVPQGYGSLRDRVAKHLRIPSDSEVMDKIAWLGLLGGRKIGLDQASPADILEHLLLEKWRLQPEDKDMVIMQHEYEYELDGQRRLLTSTLVQKGQDAAHTAMTRLVGLPLGICTKLILDGTIRTPGVRIPVSEEVYNPVLAELEKLGVYFVESEQELP